MRAFGFIFFLALILAITSCSKPGPEEVVRNFQELMAAGNCDSAKSLAIDAAADFVQQDIERGCVVYLREIISIECLITGDSTASCRTSERLQGILGNEAWGFDLKKVNGDWKIHNVYNPLFEGPWKEL